MDGIITAINSPLAIKLISMIFGIVIGALAAWLRSRKKRCRYVRIDIFDRLSLCILQA